MATQQQTFGEKRKTIAFNLDNANEREMYELARRTNFTQLVKRLLAAEIQRQRIAEQRTAQRGASQQPQQRDKAE